MEPIVVIIVVAVIVIVVAQTVLWRRSRRSSASDHVTAQPAAYTLAPDNAAATPMTGLEAALAQVTDRSGKPIGEHLDAESQHVDDLRVPDDTGPLLRRALDHVEHQDDGADAEDPSDSTGG
jgi:hypothetical protein